MACIPATRGHGPSGAGPGALPFGGAPCGIAASFPSRYRCRPSPCAGLSPARSTTAAPPHPARSAVGAPIPASGPDARRREPAPGGSRVHCHSIGGLGARLCPSGLAMGTPQAFPMASPGWSRIPPGKFPPRNDGGTRRARPLSTRFEPVHGDEGRNDTGSSRTPFRHARRARPIWRCWHVPALSGLLPPSPAPPGSGCPQLHRPAATGRRRRSLTSTRTTAPRCAEWRSLAAQPCSRRESCNSLKGVHNVLRRLMCDTRPPGCPWP